MDKKYLDTLTTKQIFKAVFGYLYDRHSKRLYEKWISVKSDWMYRPLGKLSVWKHSISDRVYTFLYDRGYLSRPKESLEVEFDKYTKTCLSKEFMPRLLSYCQENDAGNTHLVSEMNGRPCFTALGAYAYKDYINKAEFDIKLYPYSQSFVGGHAVSRHYVANLKAAFEQTFEKMFVSSFGIDTKWTASAHSNAYYSRGLVNMAPWFATMLYQNEEVDFFTQRFLNSYLRMVHLEQRKLDVSSDYIRNLRRRWEQELVHDFTLGVTLIGLSQYAFVYKCLPASVQKRVPAFRARSSYDKQGVYRRPTQEFKRIERKEL
jgi:hypothetical protein